MVGGDLEEVGNGEALGHGDDDGVGVVDDVRAHAGGSDDFAGGTVGGEDDETVFFSDDFTFALVVESIFGRDGIESGFFGGVGGEADLHDFGVGEDSEHVKAGIPGGFERRFFEKVGDIRSGGFALHDGEVDDGEGAGAVAGGEDMRNGGLAVFVDFNAAQLGFESGFFEIEAIETRGTAGGHDELLAGKGGAFGQGQGEAIVSVGDFLQTFAKDEVDAEIGAAFFHGFGDSGLDGGDEGLAT